MPTDPSWSILVMTQNVRDTMDHRAGLLIQRFGSSWMASGRHSSGVDPNDPCFWSKSPKFFRDAYVRINVRGRAGGRSMWVLIFFLYGSLLIIIIIWRSDAIQQWSNPMDHDGSTWIIKPTSALGFMIQMSRTIYVIPTMDQVGSRVFSPVESRAYDLWSNLIHGCKDTRCPIILPHYELWSNCLDTLDHIS